VECRIAANRLAHSAPYGKTFNAMMKLLVR
jgi:hypothetical protein